MAGEKILMHCCCGPCSSACIERLAPDYDMTLFFYNPCIDDRDEYEKRKANLIKLVDAINANGYVGVAVDGDQNPAGAASEHPASTDRDPASAASEHPASTDRDPAGTVEEQPAANKKAGAAEEQPAANKKAGAEVEPTVAGSEASTVQQSNGAGAAQPAAGSEASTVQQPNGAGITQLKYGPVKVVEGKYDPENYLEAVRCQGLENEPEGGARCAVCFRMRLLEAARYAKEQGFDGFTTTLTVSPHKNYQVISAIGREIGEEVGIEYYPFDFKKKDGFLHSIRLSKAYGLYRQDYCGCRFSKR